MRYAFDPDRSDLEVRADSSLHPITTSTTPTGWLEVTLDDQGRVDPAGPVAGEVEIDLTTMRAGNPLLDREAERRLHVRRFPTAVATLTGLAATDEPGTFVATGELAFHGVTRALTGNLRIESDPDGIVVEGTIPLDVTDFDVQPPSLLLVKVHAEVQVTLTATARPA